MAVTQVIMSIAHFSRKPAELARSMKSDYSVTQQVEKMGDRNEKLTCKETSVQKIKHVVDAREVPGILCALTKF